MKTIVLANAKGGTGKTTIAVNLSAGLALHHGKRVLGIDLDSQGNFGISYDVDPRLLTHTAFHLLTAEAPDVRAYIKEIKPNLHLIPNAISPDLENRLEASHNRDSLLRLRLRQIKKVSTPATTPDPDRRLTPAEIIEQSRIIAVLLESDYTLEQAEKQFAASAHPDDWAAILEAATAPIRAGREMSYTVVNRRASFHTKESGPKSSRASSP